jgi:GDP-mannose transporter
MAEKEKQDSYRVDMPSDDSKPFIPTRPQSTTPVSAPASAPSMAIFSYCAASILMTVTNKYVLAGTNFNLNFFLLCVQVSFTHPLIV